MNLFIFEKLPPVFLTRVGQTVSFQFFQLLQPQFCHSIRRHPPIFPMRQAAWGPFGLHILGRSEFALRQDFGVAKTLYALTRGSPLARGNWRTSDVSFQII
jgi:hypothetical protein